MSESMASALEDCNEPDATDGVLKEIARVERVVAAISDDLYEAERELSELKEKLQELTS